MRLWLLYPVLVILWSALILERRRPRTGAVLFLVMPVLWIVAAGAYVLDHHDGLVGTVIHLNGALMAVIGGLTASRTREFLARSGLTCLLRRQHAWLWTMADGSQIRVTSSCGHPECTEEAAMEVFEEECAECGPVIGATCQCCHVTR